MYRLLRPLLFRLDAEHAHELTIGALAFAARHPGLLRMMSWLWSNQDERLRTEVFGLGFSNPVGLAAGMDKNAVAVPAWAALGFGAAEVGTITALQQDGNPGPRLFRLKEDRALINRMGFNNDGAAAVMQRLQALGRADDPESARPAGLALGMNVGKSRVRPIGESAADYREVLEQVWPCADYVVLNVSSPNTPGLRTLQDREPLMELLEVARSLQEPVSRPVLLKIAPDLTEPALLEICELAGSYGLAGLIATNTTIERSGLKNDPAEQGGLSGRPLDRRSLEVLRFLRANSDLPLVSVGGIWTVADAVARMRAGASLLQLYTAYVYRGPGLVRQILAGLLREVEREGASGVADLVGLDA